MSSVMSGLLFLVLTISLQCGICHSDREVRTSPVPDTRTTYIGRAYKTEFGLQQFTTAKFLGIPFAEPPKRFSKPVLNTPKDEVFHATKFGAICPQIIDMHDYCNQNQTMSESCLYLNIYVPLPTTTPQDLMQATVCNTSMAKCAATLNGTGALLLPSNDTKFAVFIFIHGGAYTVGNGNCVDGSVLAGHGNIIVVTINYRLGNLGFLSTNDDVIPGNLGLWDQFVAIKWVKQHIHVFGGDPDRITVGGQSAGSYSAIYQALYEGNKNVFHRVIAQSGTPTAVKSANTMGYNVTLEVARILNCKITGTKQEVKSCLMSKSAESLTNVLLSIIVPGSLPVQPTVDDPFVIQDPYTVLSQMATSVTAKKPTVPKHFISKDMLIGVDAQDGDIVLRLYTGLISRGNSLLYNILLRTPISHAQFKSFIRNYFQKSDKDLVDESVVEAVFDRYVDWENPDDYSYLNNRVIEMLTDVFFAIPSLDTASAHVEPQISVNNTVRQRSNTSTTQFSVGGQREQGRTFVYRFNAPNPRNSDMPWFVGTGHASEVAYVFGNFWLKDETNLNLSRTIMTYWSNFVKSGDPNRDSPHETEVDIQEEKSLGLPKSQLPPWHEYNNDDEQYLEISAYPATRSHLRANYRHFWTQYIPKLRYHLQNVFNDGVKTGKAQKCAGRKSNGQDMLRVKYHIWVLLGGLVLIIKVYL